MKQKYANWLAALLLFAVIITFFQTASALSPRMNFLFGSPFAIGKSLAMNITNGTLPYDLLLTGLEAITGFLIGIAAGTLAGFLLWYSPRIAQIFHPYIFVAGVIPIFAFAPIIIVWFGIGVPMKIALAGIGTFLVSFTQAYEGAKSVDADEFRLLRTFGASRKQILQKAIFPASISWVFAAMKLNVGFALLGAFVGEFISASRGIGHFMLLAGSFYDIPSIFAGGIMLVLLALLLHCGVTLLERKKRAIIGFLSVDRKLKKLVREA